MAAAKPPKPSSKPVLKQKSIGMNILFPGLRREDGQVSITPEALAQLQAAFKNMKGNALRVALEEVVLFAKFLLENLKSPKAATAVLDVANTAVTLGSFAPPSAPSAGGWKKK